MAKQSRDMTILLTRPAGQSLRFATELKLALPDIPIVISPLMVPEYLTPPIPAHKFAAVVLVSVAAVEAAKRISASRFNLPLLAYCVGDRTAMAAKAIGLQTMSAKGDAADLLAMIVGDNPGGPLLFLRGHDTTGNIAKDLLSAGIDTVSAVAYQQKAESLNPKAVALLQGDAPVIVPLFSTRSATILHAEKTRIAAKAPLLVAALSPAIAAAIPQETVARLVIAAHPDSAAMILSIQALARSIGAP